MTTVKWLLRNFEALISCFAFLTMVLVVIFNVFLRYLTGVSLVFTEEIAYLCFSYSVFFGVSILYRHNHHIAVEFFVDMLPARLKQIVTISVTTMLLFATIYFCYLSFYLASGGWLRRTAFLKIPYFVVHMAPTICFGLMALYSLKHLFDLLKGKDIYAVS